MKKTLVQSASFLLALSLCGCFDEPARDLSPSSLVYAFPNPARQMGNIAVNNTSNVTGTLTVFDPKGEIVLEEDVPPGQSDFQLALKSEGKYHVVCKIGDDTYTTVILRL